MQLCMIHADTIESFTSQDAPQVGLHVMIVWMYVVAPAGPVAPLLITQSHDLSGLSTTLSAVEDITWVFFLASGAASVLQVTLVL